MAIYLSKRGDTMILQYNEEPLSNEYRALLKEYGIGVIVSELNKCSKTNQVLRLHKIIKEIEPDVIHFHFGNVAFGSCKRSRSPEPTKYRSGSFLRNDGCNHYRNFTGSIFLYLDTQMQRIYSKQKRRKQ